MKELKIDIDGRRGGVDLERLGPQPATAWRACGRRALSGDRWASTITGWISTPPRIRAATCGDHLWARADLASTSSPPCCARGTTGWWRPWGPFVLADRGPCPQIACGVAPDGTARQAGRSTSSR